MSGQSFAMLVSILALITQIIFGILSTRRAIAETERQIAETKKQEKLHALAAEENYKSEVRQWGREVVKNMSLAQQLCKINPAKFTTSDYDLERGQTVAKLRGLLDKAKWLFPGLALPTFDEQDWGENANRRLSALETILHAYHILDKCRSDDEEHRKECVRQLRKLRKKFVLEMRRAVDPAVRGEEIERLIDEVEDEIQEEKESTKGKEKNSIIEKTKISLDTIGSNSPPPSSAPISSAEAQVLRK